MTYTYQASTLRLLSQNSTSFDYDNSGNTTSAGSNTFTYTTDQQLDTATVGGVETTYGYDGDGWRATRSRAGQVSDYLRGPGGQLLSEVQNPGTSLVLVRDYIYLGSQLLAVTGVTTSSITFTDPMITAGTTAIRAIHLTELRALLQQPGTNGVLRYYHTDAIGSVRMTTDHVGNVIARFDYQPFGEPLAASGEPRRFTGAERDADTGFDYLGARYLSSAIGRFTRSDDPGFANPGDPQSFFPCMLSSRTLTGSRIGIVSRKLANTDLVSLAKSDVK